ncbi:MAG: cytochrome c class [Bacilli bacterium]|nr:cytochrome c class [Bacilli bacterium]
MADHSGHHRIPGTPRYRQDKELAHGTEPFFPNFLLKEWIVGAMLLVAFLVWVRFNPVDLGPYANPQDTSFIPIPDWYFLFLYQLLKYFPGNVIWLGTVVIPGLASALLLLAPWLDLRKVRHPFKRPVATSAMVLSVLLMYWTTYEANGMYQEELKAHPPAATSANAPQPINPAAPGGAATKLVATSDPGYADFKATCAACHGADLKGKIGPSLIGIGNQMDRQALEAFVTQGKGLMPARGGLQADDPKLTAILDWVEKQKQQQ